MDKIFDFLHQIESLKSTYRYNRTKSGDNESVAAHSWRLSLLVLVAAQELGITIDTNRAIKIALCHDLAESITGDIDAIKIAKGEFSKFEKQKLERKAMHVISGHLSPKTGTEIYNFWQEYEDSNTPEAKFVKALDKIETLTQLYEVGYKFYDQPEFIANYADKAVRNVPELRPMLIKLKSKLKSEFEKGDIAWESKFDKL